MEQNRGIALILALLVLSFLTVVGGALLTTSTIDIWISAAGMVDTVSLKGVHHCIKSGMLAAETIHATLARGSSVDDDHGAILAAARALGATRIVVGLPRSLKGGEGPAAVKVRAFAQELAKGIAPVPVRRSFPAIASETSA